jgi:hypothetical protein
MYRAGAREIRLTNPDSDPLVFDQLVLLNTAFFLAKALSSTTGHDQPMLLLKMALMIWISLSFIDVLLAMRNNPRSATIAPDDKAASRYGEAARVYERLLKRLVRAKDSGYELPRFRISNHLTHSA